MADFTTTTNLNLKKPAIGGSSDKWGEYLNSDLDTIDTEIQSLKTASTSRSLESLSNVLDLTPTTGQLLQYDTANWKAATVTIPEDIDDLGNVAVSSPTDGQVLAYSASNSRWENQSAGAATIPAGSITTAKLSTSLQGQVNLILQTTGTPTDDQILRYNASTTNWEFQDLPGGTISSLSDTDVSAISNQDVLVYNSTSGDWVSRPLAIADVAGLQTELDAKLESSDLSVSSLTDTTITTTADNSFLVYDASDSKWKNEGPSTARSSLGLAIGTDVQAYDADTTKNDVSNTFSANQIISVSDNTNAAFRITQTGTGNALVVEDSANPDSTPFVVTGSGITTIGHTGGISYANSTHLLQITGANQMSLGRWLNDPYAGIITQAKSRSTTVGVNSSVLSGDAIGRYRFVADDGTNFIEAARIEGSVDGTPGANDMPGRLVFSTTADGSSSPTERMRIDSDGNVGIGTTNPEYPLHVSSNDGLIGLIPNSTNGNSIRFGGVGGAANQLIFKGTGDAERMRIDGSGNVGIGTTSPSEKLDVSGNINATGALTLGTALAITEGGTGVTALSSLDAADLGSGAATDGYILTADGAGGAAWEAASGISLPIDLLSSGASIRKSDGTTAVLSESGGAVTLENVTNLEADSITDKAGTGAPDFPNGLTLAGNTTGGNITGVTLDSYEEGTYTVTLYDASSGGNASSTTTTGYYTKIGRVVTCSFDGLTNISTAGMTTTNVLYMSLPFPAAQDSSSGTLAYSLINTRQGTGEGQMVPFVLSGNSRARFYGCQADAAVASIRPAELTSGTSDILVFSMTYIV